MPKTRLQKEEMLDRTIDRVERSQSIVFVNIAGVKVDQIEQVRDSLFTQGLQLQVAKNNLARIAFGRLHVELPSELLDQPLGMIYSYSDPVAGAKLSQPFVKEFEAFEIVGGLVNGQFVSAKQVESLALLPAREQLLGQLVGTLAAPITGFLNVLEGNLSSFVRVLAQIQEQKTV